VPFTIKLVNPVNYILRKLLLSYIYSVLVEVSKLVITIYHSQ